jgi:hypothetical protein
MKHERAADDQLSRPIEPRLFALLTGLLMMRLRRSTEPKARSAVRNGKPTVADSKARSAVRNSKLFDSASDDAAPNSWCSRRKFDRIRVRLTVVVHLLHANPVQG